MIFEIASKYCLENLLNNSKKFEKTFAEACVNKFTVIVEKAKTTK